jgi:hypothetical protein|tara:strand:- start:147 stop:431 length:285 start_codon:yes stop_codon:yes gene_type:complete
MRINKKGGIIGGFMGLFIMTIIVVLILVVFVLGSGVVKKMNNVQDGVALYDETNVGLAEVLNYSASYSDLVEVRFLVEDGVSVDEALEEVGYEE